MASANSQAQQSINNEVVGKLNDALGTGTWYYPDSGTSQVVYPTFNDANGNAYYPGFELANLYAAYAPNTSSLAISATTGSDPVASNGGGVDLQTSGLTSAVASIYGGLSFSLRASDQAAQSDAAAAMESSAASAVSQLQKNYESVGGAWDYFADNLKSTETGISNYQTALNDLVTIIMSPNMNNILKSGGQLDSYYKKAFPDGDTTNAAGRDQFSANAFQFLYGGTFDFSKELNSSFGPLVQQGFAKVPQYQNAWSSSITSQWNSAATSSQGQSWTSLQNQKNTNVQLKNTSQTYLNNYELMTQGSGNPAATAASYQEVVAGIPNAPAAVPTFLVSPLSGAQTGNSLIYQLNTEGKSSSSSASSESSSVTWDAGSDGNWDGAGWFFGYAASNTGSKESRTSWSKYDESANKLEGKFTWDSITAQTLIPGSQWLNGTMRNAISQAWDSKMTADNPTFKGGWAFASPDQANQYVTSSLHYISSVAYGKPTSTISGSKSSSSEYNSDTYESFQQTTKAKSGFGWGPFSIGGETKYSTSNSSSSSQYDFTDNGSSFVATNDPLMGLQSVPGAGEPSGLLGVQLATLGTAIQPLSNSDNQTAFKRKGKKNTFTYADPDSSSSKENPYSLGSGKDTHFGSDTDKDWVRGGNGKDVIAGLGGNDRLYGEKGDDVIYPGAGKDKVFGGKGSDYVVFQKEHVLNGHSAKVMDFSSADNISFSGEFVIDDIKVAGKSLKYQGFTFAKFKGLSSDDLVEMLSAAHHSNVNI